MTIYVFIIFHISHTILYRFHIVYRFKLMLNEYNEYLLVTKKPIERSTNQTTSPERTNSESLENETTNTQSLENNKELVTPLKQTHSQRQLAVSSKRKRQDAQAANMIRRRIQQNSSKIGVGAVVTISLDKREFSSPTGVRAIVFELKEETGGILACCESGVITQSTGEVFWIPSDRYGVTASPTEPAVLTDGLNTVRHDILNRKFDSEKKEKTTLIKAQKDFMGRSPRKRTACQCKGGRCGRRCGCKRNRNAECSSSCSCNGNCNNGVTSK